MTELEIKFSQLVLTNSNLSDDEIANKLKTTKPEVKEMKCCLAKKLSNYINGQIGKK